MVFDKPVDKLPGDADLSRNFWQPIPRKPIGLDDEVPRAIADAVALFLLERMMPLSDEQ